MLPNCPPAGPPPPRAAPASASCCTSTASPHAWLALRPTERETLIPISDDATKRVLFAQLVAAESTAAIMLALWSVLVTHGLSRAPYSDRASWAF